LSMPAYYANPFWRMMAHLIWSGVLLFTVAILLIVGTLIYDHFLSLTTLQAILTHLLTIGLMASVMVIIVSQGSLDLSVGSVMSLVGTVAALLLQQGASPLYAFILGLSLALLIGIVNGLLVGFARIPGILITFAMMYLVRGISDSLLGNVPIRLPESDALLLAGFNVTGWIVLILVGLTAAVSIQFPIQAALQKKFPPALSAWLTRIEFSGLPYVCSSVLAGFVGLLQAVRLQAAIPTPNIGFEVQVILAVVLGGTCLGCRFGNVIGAFAGALVIAIVQHLLALKPVSSFQQQFIIGALFVVGTGLCYGYHELVSRLYQKQAQERK